jgi:hypothetical protein
VPGAAPPPPPASVPGAAPAGSTWSAPADYPPAPPAQQPSTGAAGYSGAYPPPAPYPYAAPPPAAAPTDDKAVWALVTSIAGWFLCPIVLHVVGWVLANSALQTIRASGGTVGGDGLAKAARIISIAGLVFYGALVLFWVFAVLLGLLASAAPGQ